MKSSGKTYQNHYATILNWYEGDKDKLTQKGLNKKMNYDVGESLQIKKRWKGTIKDFKSKRYQSMPEIKKYKYDTLKAIRKLKKSQKTFRCKCQPQNGPQLLSESGPHIVKN